jgi:hypothetical protein
MMHQHYIAFIDILGFSEMVAHDCKDPNKSYLNLNRLKSAIQTLSTPDPSDISALQFSDSIVLSLPFLKNDFDRFIRTCKSMQQELFLQGILCRGGISVGRHHHEGNFLFSEGLIEAYQLESKLARTPRIIVSRDLIELLAYPRKTIQSDHLCRESDGEVFIDYLGDIDEEILHRSLTTLKDSLGQVSSSARDKITWLLDYAHHRRQTPRELVIERFC